MRGRYLQRRLFGALVMGLLWFSLTASVEAPQVLLPPADAPPAVVAQTVAPVPISCVGTLLDFRATTLRLSDWPKLIVSLDVTRADRCVGRFGRPVGRLHGFMVVTRDRLSVRTYLRANQQSPWVQLCRAVRTDCMDVNAVLRWPSFSDKAQ